MRTYSFDNFKADKPEPSTTNPGGAEQTPPAEQAKPRSDNGQLHYGRQHAQTAALYRKHREERERAEQLRASEAQAGSMSAGAAPTEAKEQQAAEPLRQDTQDVEAPQAVETTTAGPEGLKGLAQQAVSSVVAVAKEAAKAHPLSKARKLAGEAFSGVRRVAQQVSARAVRSEKKDEQKGGAKKGPSKKH